MLQRKCGTAIARSGYLAGDKEPRMNLRQTDRVRCLLKAHPLAINRTVSGLLKDTDAVKFGDNENYRFNRGDSGGDTAQDKCQQMGKRLLRRLRSADSLADLP